MKKLIVAIAIMFTIGCTKTIIVPCPQYILIMQVQNQSQGQSTLIFRAGNTNSFINIDLMGLTNVKYYFGTNGTIKEVSNFPPNELLKFTNYYE